MTMVKRRPDPGGVFASDDHRRVLGHLPIPGDDPISIQNLLLRMVPDTHTNFKDTDDLGAVLLDLSDAGHAEQVESDEWCQSEDGFSALTGPIASEPAPMEGEQLKAAEKSNKELASLEAQIAKEAKK